MHDRRGNPVSTASAEALEHAERALWRLMTFYGTPLDDLDAAAAADPGWVLPAVMKAGFLIGLGEAGFAREGASVLDAAEPLLAAATERERAHFAALGTLQAGDWDGARRAWEALLQAHPRDAMALQWAHLFDFYRGDAERLRERPAAVLPAWSADDPLRPHVVAMHAFGLEESNRYAEAEAAGRAALEAEPKAPWAVHAVAHVMEMQGRHAEGTRWLVARRGEWARGNGFSVHLGWHQALFALERLDIAAALALHDEHIAAANTTVALERLDSASLLWRLHLVGADVGPRWRALVDAWRLDEDAAGHYAFNDAHALLALIGAGECARAEAWLRATRERAEAAGGTNRAMAREVGVPLMQGLLAFADGRWNEAVETLGAVRGVAHRFGGSHAQRDLIDQTLLAASARSGSRAAGRALLAARAALKGGTPLTAHWAERLSA